MFVTFEVKSEDEKIFDKYGKYKGKFDDDFLIPLEIQRKNNKQGSLSLLMESFLERLKVVGRFMTLMENTKEELKIRKDFDSEKFKIYFSPCLLQYHFYYLSFPFRTITLTKVSRTKPTNSCLQCFSI